MSTTLSIIILAEVLFTLFIVWGFMHEEKFVAFEDKIIFAVIRMIKRGRSDREAARREKVNERVAYTPVKPVRSSSASSRDNAA